MKNSARIFGASSGQLDAKVMFVGEAPGRLGADSTGVPFHGDKAGDNFESLLDFAGVSREDIFVTNAVLCNPRDESGNNSTPRLDEIANCAQFLRRQITLINPAIVVTLGANALRATALVQPHKLTLREHVRSEHSWHGRILIPLYHPGQRAMIHRSLSNQRSDYQFVADQMKRLGVKPRRVRGTTHAAVADAVRVILRAKGEVSYFALHKLLYLLEWSHMANRGSRLTGAYFIRQKDGPYCTDLQITKLKTAIPELQIHRTVRGLSLSLPMRTLFDEVDSAGGTNDVDMFVQKELQRLSGKTDAELKTKAYMTKPMRAILRREKNDAANLYNSPVLLGW
jgi:uracil-DNA glycosylase family 4